MSPASTAGRRSCRPDSHPRDGSPHERGLATDRRCKRAGGEGLSTRKGVSGAEALLDPAPRAAERSEGPKPPANSAGWFSPAGAPTAPAVLPRVSNHNLITTRESKGPVEANQRRHVHRHRTIHRQRAPASPPVRRSAQAPRRSRPTASASVARATKQWNMRRRAIEPRSSSQAEQRLLFRYRDSRLALPVRRRTDPVRARTEAKRRPQRVALRRRETFKAIQQHRRQQLSSPAEGKLPSTIGHRGERDANADRPSTTVFRSAVCHAG